MGEKWLPKFSYTFVMKIPEIFPVKTKSGLPSLL